MDGNNDPGRRLSRREEEELISIIIAAYLKGDIEVEILKGGILIKHNDGRKEEGIMFPFEERNGPPVNLEG